MRTGVVIVEGPAGAATAAEWERHVTAVDPCGSVVRIAGAEPDAREAGARVRAAGLEFAVVVSPGLPDLTEFAAELTHHARIDLLNIELVPAAWARLVGPPAGASVARVAHAMLAGARDARVLATRHRKVSYGPANASVSRRGLFRSLARPRTTLVPFVDVDKCGARHGCTLCFDACPAQAIDLRKESASIKPEACISCGLCVRVCPADAVDHPILDVAPTQARLAGLLADSTERPRVVVMAPTSAVEALAPSGPVACPEADLVWLPVPCAAAVHPSTIVRAVRLGAAGVLLLTCPPESRHGPSEGRLAKANVKEASALLRLAAWNGGPVALLEPRARPQEDAASLRATLAGLVPSRASTPAPAQRLTRRLGEEARDLLRERGLTSDPSMEATTVGDVQVRAEACTLCGLCAQACPTGALAFNASPKALLTFDHAACVACGWCVPACPEKVVTLAKVLRPPMLGRPRRTLAEGSEARCRSCRAVLAPEALVQRVRVLGVESLPESWGKNLQLCPDCRLRGGLQGLAPRGDASGPKTG